MLDESNRQHKIRHVGTDARERKQPFSSVSRQNLWHMVFGKTVVVEWYKRNRYKHVLGKVLLDGKANDVLGQEETLAMTYVDPPQLTRLGKRLGFEKTVRTQDEFLAVLKKQ